MLGKDADFDAIIKSSHFDKMRLTDTFNFQRRLPIDYNPNKPDFYGVDPLAYGPSYVFMTKPDLNISGSTNEIRLNQKYLEIEPDSSKNIFNSFELVNSLSSGSSGSSENPGAPDWIYLVTNMAENIPSTDISIDVHDIGDNWIGAKMPMPNHTLQSRQNGSLSIQYEEFSGTPILLLHKLWIDYMEAVGKGTVIAKKFYTSSKLLDYSVSIFAVVCSPDGTTIEGISKYTGCFPTSIPTSILAGERSRSGNVAVDITYQFTYFESMSKRLITDFNFVASGGRRNVASIIDAPSSPGDAAVQIIRKDNRYKLIFRNDDALGFASLL